MHSGAEYMKSIFVAGTLQSFVDGRLNERLGEAGSAHLSASLASHSLLCPAAELDLGKPTRVSALIYNISAS
jgi:hypothetical protein